MEGPAIRTVAFSVCPSVAISFPDRTNLCILSIRRGKRGTQENYSPTWLHTDAGKLRCQEPTRELWSAEKMCHLSESGFLLCETPDPFSSLITLLSVLLGRVIP